MLFYTPKQKKKKVHNKWRPGGRLGQLIKSANDREGLP